MESTMNSSTSVEQNMESTVDSSTSVEQNMASTIDSLMTSVVKNSLTAAALPNDDIPGCWTRDQLQNFKMKYKWLVVSNKALGCSTCRSVQGLSAHKSKGMKLSPEWITISVVSYGSTKEKQQMSLRKKISEHKESNCHKKAIEIIQNRHEGAIERSIGIQSKEQADTTCRIFRTVYKEIKLNRPFTDIESDIDLQVLNGLNMGRILQSNVACGNIARDIGAEMRKKLLAAALFNGQKLAVLVDESTTISRICTLIIYVRMAIDNRHEPITFFLDLVALQLTTAASITAALLGSLNKHGFSDDVLRDRLVAFACDGASVMLGKNAGVAALLLIKYPRLIIWHCFAHRLELSVSDTLNEVHGTNNFKIFMDKLYSVYSLSPKNQNELKDCAAGLDVQLLKIGKILDTRWVSSSVRTVKAVWESFSALHGHFTFASQDGSRDKREQSKYSGLANHLAANEFVRNLGLMFDTLQELSELSIELQKRDISISEAHRSICRQVRVFESMSSKPGAHYTTALESIARGSFRNVTLHPGTKTDVSINHAQFCTSLAVNLRTRMMAFQSSHVAARSDGAGPISSPAASYLAFLDEVKVIDPINWPDEFDVTYGDDAVGSLAERLNIEKRSTIRAFREFKDTGGKQISTGMQPLVIALKTIPVSTAECERGFSEMNLLATPIRNSLRVETLADLMFVKLVGPPLKKFNPQYYVTKWLSKGRHTADDMNSKIRKDTGIGSDRSVDYEHMWSLL